MANPAVVEITPANTWVKVATNVTAGTIQINDSAESKNPTAYLQTYRMTGEAAPSNTSDEGSLMFQDINIEEISATAGIDVYVMARGVAGELRVNL